MSVDYTIQAKPTVYRGQTFRSRLEAKWAAFFDILKWEWVYEPFDLGGWSPDFAIRAPGASSARKIVLVEVKPIMEFDEDVAAKMVASCPRDSRDPLCCSDFELLILGLRPTEEKLGWLMEGDVWDWAEAKFGCWGGPGRIGFCHEVQSFTDRITGQHDGGHYGGLIPRGTIDAFWGRASTAVQWHPSGRRRRSSKPTIIVKDNNDDTWRDGDTGLRHKMIYDEWQSGSEDEIVSLPDGEFERRIADEADARSPSKSPLPPLEPKPAWNTGVRWRDEKVRPSNRPLTNAGLRYREGVGSSRLS
jgi:hypothetical protein